VPGKCKRCGVEPKDSIDKFVYCGKCRYELKKAGMCIECGEREIPEENKKWSYCMECAQKIKEIACDKVMDFHFDLDVVAHRDTKAREDTRLTKHGNGY